ncbi:MAG TPA: 4Fe-4S binding protein [Kouleothrix sp.]|nr:4Fe-4S binding protein [Kouleothrix sp.]
MTVEFDRGKAYVVDRGQPKLRAGQGMIAGLDVVIRHFFSAFTKKLETPDETSGVFTVQYPEERLAMPEAFRNFPILLFDDTTGQELCTSCFQCERICPPQVIHMTQAVDPTTGKPVPAVAEFMIEYDACMSCGLCAEVCPFDAIKMDHDFELATDDRAGMTVRKADLDRPVSYYETIAPTRWAEVKDGAYKKLQGNIKRRSGSIGLSPRAATAPKKAAPAAAKPAAGAAKPVAAKPAMPMAAPGKNMSEEKLARLLSIRAANAAKAGGAAPAEAEEVVATADTGDVAEAPAAVAAARPVSSGGIPFSADNLLGGVPANTTMAEDKVERLKSIRSGNLARRG